MIRITGLALAAALVSGAAGAQDAVTPWPPVTTDRHAPHNWPVPHPEAGINLNVIPSGIVFRNLTAYERLAVQRALAAVGMYSGEIDGVWGPATFTGARAYAHSIGKPRYLDDIHGSLTLFRHITN